MTDTLRIGQIGIAHTHASKLVDAPSLTVLERLNAELVGIHEPDPAMFAERSRRDTFARFRAGSTPEYYHRNHVDRYEGGIMIEENCHLVDQVAWMFGKADRVHPFFRSSARGFENMPGGTDVGLILFPTGALRSMVSRALSYSSPSSHPISNSASEKRNRRTKPAGSISKSSLDPAISATSKRSSGWPAVSASRCFRRSTT